MNRGKPAWNTLHPAPSWHPVSTLHPVNAYCTTTMRAASHCAIACCYSELCVQCTHLLLQPPLPLPAVLQLLLLLPQRFQVSSVSSESLFTVVAIVFAVIIIAVASVLRLPHLLLLLLPPSPDAAEYCMASVGISSVPPPSSCSPAAC